MNSYFRKLPLSIKLMLIGIIPVCFLIYLSAQLYNEKTQKVKLIEDYIAHIHESQNIARLMSELENERKYSYQYLLRNENYSSVILQRPRTDNILDKLNSSNDLAISGFTDYTFLNRLSSIRHSIDSSANFSPDMVMKFYGSAISRLNSLNSISSASNTFLQPVYKDLIAQKTIFEMITLIANLRINVYTTLYTKKLSKESLSPVVRLYEVFRSYETEFLLKAPKDVVNMYQAEKDTTSLRPMLAYIDTLIDNPTSDSSLNAEQWWNLSSKAKDVLKNLEDNLENRAEQGMNIIYVKEMQSRNRTLFFLIVAIILVISFVIYTTRVITQMLTELKVAAQKISLGKTGLQFHNMPNDVLGSLTRSILDIDKNNIQLAHAANAIGKGNFDVPVNPRSDEDLLGNSIERMKEDLHQLTLQKDKVQEETLELMRKKDDFLSIASHELKTPVTSLKAYTQIMQMDSKEKRDEKKEMMFKKMDTQIDKLTSLINNLLDTTRLQNGKIVYNKSIFQLNILIKEIVEEMQMSAAAHKIIINENVFTEVYADRERIGQVLTNLIGNAIKYCPDCKNIIISLSQKNENAICSIQDFGKGIQEDQQEKIFERFYRISGNNLHTYPGLGLGLFIAKEIVERHSGKIWFESESGKGSIFYFTLPLRTPD